MTPTTRAPITPEEHVQYLCGAFPTICPDRDAALLHLFFTNGNGYAWIGGALQERGGFREGRTWDPEVPAPRRTPGFLPARLRDVNWSLLGDLDAGRAGSAALRLIEEPGAAGVHRANRAWQTLALEAAALGLRCCPAGGQHGTLLRVHDALAGALGQPAWSEPAPRASHGALLLLTREVNVAPPSARERATQDTLFELIQAHFKADSGADLDMEALQLTAQAPHAALDDTPHPPRWEARAVTVVVSGHRALLASLKDAQGTPGVDRELTRAEVMAFGLRTTMPNYLEGVPRRPDQARPVPLAEDAPDWAMGFPLVDDAPRLREAPTRASRWQAAPGGWQLVVEVSAGDRVMSAVMPYRRWVHALTAAARPVRP